MDVQVCTVSFLLPSSYTPSSLIRLPLDSLGLGKGRIDEMNIETEKGFLSFLGSPISPPWQICQHWLMVRVYKLLEMPHLSLSVCRSLPRKAMLPQSFTYSFLQFQKSKNVCVGGSSYTLETWKYRPQQCFVQYKSQRNIKDPKHH